MPSTISPAARQLGAELRALRIARGMSTHAVGAAMKRSHTHISRWERGELSIKELELGGLLTVLGASAEDTDRIVGLARDVERANWLSPGTDPQLAALMESERLATRIVEVNSLLIPGLLQTQQYARSIMIGAGTTDEEADRRVARRFRRRIALDRSSPPQFVAIIGEHALRYPPCDRLVAIEQLNALANWASDSRVSVRILPMDRRYTAALEGPFVLLEFETTGPIVYLEHYRSTAHVTDRDDLKDFRAAVDHLLRRETLSEAESTELIHAIVEHLENK